MLNQIFGGKSVLFIGVKFYNYHLDIKNKMESYGAKVFFFPERDISIRYGIVNRIFPNYIERYQDYYYSSVLNKIKNKKFDYFLVIRGFKMPLWFVSEIKKNNPGITCIMYQWDSNTNSQFLGLNEKYNIVPEFDRVLSFDYKDVSENKFIKYSPTFYIDEVQNLECASEEETVDFFYFGSYLPERYKGLVNFAAFTKANNYRLYSYFYMSFRYYIIERLKGVELDRKLIKFKPMTRQQYLHLLCRSKVIIDVSNSKQTGLAMRVIDAIGSNKKVLTTNAWVKHEPSYDSSQIAIFDIDNIEISSDFMKKELSKSSHAYSIDQWLVNIFCSN